MLIALEGMDGVGKSSLSKLAARLLKGMPIVKAIHPLCHPEDAIDNFMNVSSLVLSEQREEFSRCRFGVRGVFVYFRLNDVPMVSDRFYASNLWHVERRDVDVRRLVDLVGIPERTILLYASKEVLRRRITGRNVDDKDLEKVEMSERAYDLMRERFEKLSIPFVEMSTDGLGMDALASAIAGLYGRENYRRGRKRYRAFSFPPSLVRRLVVPQDVEMIDSKAFFYLCHLSSFDVHRKNRFFKSVHGVLFSRDGSSLVCYPRAKGWRSFSVSAGVRSIAPSAFLNAERLEKIRLPEGLSEIGSTAFFNCKALRRIRLPASACIIGPMNFLGCWALKGIDINSGNRSYVSEDGVLYDSLKDVLVKFPAAKPMQEVILNCRVVKAWAFAEARFLRRAELGSRVESIEAYAFMNSEVEEVVISSAVFGHIGERAFALCSRLRRVEVLDASSNIDVHTTAFEGCDERLKVMLPVQVFRAIWGNPRKEGLYGLIRSVVGIKDAGESCGIAALRHMLRLFALECNDCLKCSGGFWIFDLASVLVNRLGLDCVSLTCHKSRLMEDFFCGMLEEGFDGRRAIERYIGLGGTIKRGTIVRESIAGVSSERTMLMLVDNSVLHGYEGAGGRHYVVVEEVRGAYAIIVNPMSSICVEEIVPVDVLVSSCEVAGGWILSATRQVNA